MRARWLTILCLAAVCGLDLAMAAVGATRPSPWPNSAVAAVSITMDDGYANQWRLMAPMLEKRGFKGTFFLVTDWLDEEDHWPRWRAVAAHGHEIGSHGVTHRPLPSLRDRTITDELERSRRIIQEELGPAQGISFAFPRSAADTRLAALVQAAGYEGARVGGDSLNPDAPDQLYMVHAFHPVSTTTVDEMKSWVDEALQSGGWLVIGVHGIIDPKHRYAETQEGWEPLPMKSYAALLDCIAAAKSRLWVAPFGEVNRYIRRREASSSSVQEVSSNRIRVQLRGAAEAGPMAFTTTVPAGWSKVRLTIDGREQRTVTTQPDGASAADRIVRFAAALPASVILSPAAFELATAR